MQRASLLSLSAVSALVLLSSCGGDGGSSSTTTPPTLTVPGAPVLNSAMAGNAQATLAFAAPASNGGAAIMGYSASCSAGATSRTASGAQSPLIVTDLVNGTAYACTVSAINSVGTGSASNSINVTPVASASGSTSTAPVACSYATNIFNSSASVNAQSISSWSCTSTNRTLTSNGIPDHEVGTFPNPGNPNTIKAQSLSASYTLTPAQTGSVNTTLVSLGYALNGIKFEPGTGGTCNDSGNSCSVIGGTGNWRIEALGQTSFDFGVDLNNAHVQPTGEYHYHGMPEKLIEKLNKGQQMTLVGWAADGFPIYARYGYSSANDASSPIKLLVSSYRLKSTPDSGRPAVSLYPLGTFRQDYEYVAGLGDLDECNGRSGVTPEFPSGIYHYFITNSYPYIQRCVKGSAASSTPPPR